MIHDDLRPQPVKMNLNEGGMCLFNLNTDGTANLFDGNLWKTCGPKNPSDLEVFNVLFTTLILVSNLF